MRWWFGRPAFRSFSAMREARPLVQPQKKFASGVQRLEVTCPCESDGHVSFPRIMEPEGALHMGL
jgi:hypothetical protein